MLRVMHLATRLNTGGVARHLAATLPLLPCETLLVHGSVEPHETELADAFRDAPFRRVRIPSLRRAPHPFRDAAATAAVVAAAREFRPHIIHTHMAKAGLVGLLAAESAGVRVTVHTYHGDIHTGHFGAARSALFATLQRRVRARTTAAVFVSRSLLHTIRRRVGLPRRFAIVPPAVTAPPRTMSRAEARRKLGLPENAPVVGWLGRMARVKNLPLLVEAFARGAPRDAALLLAGDGPRRKEAERAASRAGVADRLFMTGWLSETAAFYAATDVTALSSRTEGFSLSAAEALLAGVPVVTTSAAGVLDVLGADDSGPPLERLDGVILARDERMLAAALDAAFETLDALRASTGAAAARLAATCSPEIVAEAHARTYRRLTGKMI